MCAGVQVAVVHVYDTLALSFDAATLHTEKCVFDVIYFTSAFLAISLRHITALPLAKYSCRRSACLLRGSFSVIDHVGICLRMHFCICAI